METHAGKRRSRLFDFVLDIFAACPADSHRHALRNSSSVVEKNILRSFSSTMLQLCIDVAYIRSSVLPRFPSARDTGNTASFVKKHIGNPTAVPQMLVEHLHLHRETETNVIE